MTEPIQTTEEELNSLLATREYLRTNIQASRQKLSDTPRGDKQGAHEIRQQILRDESEIKNLRPLIAKLQERFEGQKRHSDFMAAIADLYGQDAIRSIQQRMKEMRFERKQARTEAYNRGLPS